MNRRIFLLLIALTTASLLSIVCQTTSLLTNNGDTFLQTAFASEREWQTPTLKSKEFVISDTTSAVNFVVAKPAPTPMKSKPINTVCPDPQKPCKTKDKEFGVWELSFRLPAKIKPNTNYKSAPFFAIILKKYDGGCDDLDVNPKIEPERLKIQKFYPARKVFASYDCANLDATGYEFAGRTNKNGDAVYNEYVAVYAGETQEEADQLLDEIKTKFPKAVVKKMTANWELIDQ
jgi:hypothetical protein